MRWPEMSERPCTASTDDTRCRWVGWAIMYDSRLRRASERWCSGKAGEMHMTDDAEVKWGH